MCATRTAAELSFGTMLFGALCASPAFAACVTSAGNVTNCTGNTGVYPFVRTLGGGSETFTYNFSGLTQGAIFDVPAVININSTGLSAHHNNDDGQSGQSLALSFVGAPYGIRSGRTGVWLQSLGGHGDDGEDRSDTGVVHGAEAGAGGAGGIIDVTWTSGYLHANTGMLLTSQGGDGGKGGEGKSFTGSGSGGDGGDGGNGGAVSLTIAAGAPVDISAAFGRAISLSSTGGDGDRAGKGAALVGQANGAHGGVGGSGGGT